MDKIKEKVRDAKDTLTYKLTGNKYHNNLLGESLSDMLRKATAKTLVTPDENLNQQVRENQGMCRHRDHLLGP